MATAAKKAAAKPTPVRRPVVNRAVADAGESTAELVEKSTPPVVNLKQEDAEDGEKVTVIVPKQFTLTRDNGTSRVYEQGVQEMLVDDAVHWYARANGVMVYDPNAQE